jgi:nuclear-control-of-ATPase protein 2
LILSPFVILYGYKYIYASRASVLGTATDAWITVRGFWQGWLVDPLKDVLRTVKIGGEGGVIVQKEALAADLAVSPSPPCRIPVLDLLTIDSSL